MNTTKKSTNRDDVTGRYVPLEDRVCKGSKIVLAWSSEDATLD